MPADFYTPKTLTVYFPNGKVCCKNCWLCTADRLNRSKCMESGEIIFFPNEVGTRCPLKDVES